MAIRAIRGLCGIGVLGKTGFGIICGEHYRPLAGYGLPPPPRGNFVDHIFLEAQCLAKILQHVSPLTMAALSCNSLLHTLPYKMFDKFFLKLQKSAKDKVRFPNWLYFLNKLLLGHR